MTWNGCGDAGASRSGGNRDRVGDARHPVVSGGAQDQSKAVQSLRHDFKEPGHQIPVLDEYEGVGVRYGNQNYYPDTKGKCYYCFFRKTKLSKATDMSLVDYRHYPVEATATPIC
jgi:hypothetical protein